MSLLVDFGRALAQMGDRRFRRVLIWSLLLTIAALAAMVWGLTTLLGFVLPDSVSLPWIGSVGFVDDALSWAAVGVMLALSVVLMVPTAAAVVGFFLDDVADAVEARHYAQLPPPRQTPIARQIGDSVRFLALVLGANAVAVIIYFAIPPLAPFIFWLVNGFLLGREYFQLVAQRRLGAEAVTRLRRANRGKIWLAGTAMAAPMSVPVFNLIVPILGVAVFTHQFHRMAGDAETTP